MNLTFYLSLYFILILLAMVVGVFVLRWIFRFRSRYSFDNFKSILEITVPKGSRNSEHESDEKKWQDLIGLAESFFTSIGGLKPESGIKSFFHGRSDHYSFEIVARDNKIYFYVAIPTAHVRFISQQIHAQYPDAHLNEIEDYNIFKPQSRVLGSYLVLTRRHAFPLRTYKNMESDPLNAVTNTLSKFSEEDGAAIQILVRPTSPAWRRLGQDIVLRLQQGESPQRLTNPRGPVLRFLSLLTSSLFDSWSGKNKETSQDEHKHQLSPLEQKMVEAIEEKMSRAALEVNVRVVVSTADKNKTRQYLKDISNAFSQFNIYEYGNTLKSIIFAPDNQIINDFIYRNFVMKRKLILNTEELASLFHLPNKFTETPNIHWLEARKAAPPINIPKEGLVLGKSIYRGDEITVRIKPEDRMRHLYVIGKSGTGKSVFLQNLIIQDIQEGRGVAVVDPHGDLVEEVLGHVPKERAEDLVYFNPADTEQPIGLNMLEAKTPDEMDFVAQEMISIFYKLVPNPEMIGPMFEHNMRNVMLTLMSNTENPGTMADIPRMFTDTSFQKYNLQFVHDPIVRSFWEKEMAQTSDFHKSEMLGYLISKVGRFVENEMIRNIIGQPKSGFNFRDIMDKQKILLVNLSKGTTGEVNSNLLGLIIVSKLQMAALQRANIPEHERKDFFLYIDEFQNFITDSIATILSEARKYRLSLTIAHQYISQLIQNKDEKIRDAVFGNAGTIVAFRVGVEDAEYLAKEFEPIFDENDVINIQRFTAYIKLLIDNTASRAFNMHTLPPQTGDRELASKLKELSRLQYGRAKQIVETEILKRTKLGETSRSPEI